MRAIEQVRKVAGIWHALRFEAQLFHLAETFCGGAYGGGKWTSKQLPSGQWIAIPPIDGTFEISNPDNFSSATVNAFTAGAIITVIALNRTLWAAHNKEGQTKNVEALHDLWDETNEACRDLKDVAFDKTAFYRITD